MKTIKVFCITTLLLFDLCNVVRLKVLTIQSNTTSASLSSSPLSSSLSLASSSSSSVSSSLSASLSPLPSANRQISYPYIASENATPTLMTINETNSLLGPNQTENREIDFSFNGAFFDLLQERELGDLLLIQTILTVTDQAPKETYKDSPYQGQWRRIGK